MTELLILLAIIVILLVNILAVLVWLLIRLGQQRDLIDGLGDMLGEALDVWYEDTGRGNPPQRR